MLGCVEKEGVGISHYLWLKKRKTCIAQLTHHLPAKRLSLEEALSVNGSATVPNKTLVGFSIIALLVLIGSASIFSFTWYQKSTPELATDSPIQLLVLNDPQYPLLETINTLLRYPLSTHPNIVLDNKEQTQAWVRNLGLSPFTKNNDRTDLAATLAANTVLLLDATPTSNSAYLLHASLLSMPTNTPIFTVSHNVDANTLSEDLVEFSNKLIEQLFDAVETQAPQPLPDLRYLDALDSAWQKGETLNSTDAVDAITATTPITPVGG